MAPLGGGSDMKIATAVKLFEAKTKTEAKHIHKDSSSMYRISSDDGKEYRVMMVRSIAWTSLLT